MTLLIVYFCLTLIFSFICSFLEASFLSITPSYISVLRKKNQKVSQLLKQQKAKIGRSLSAILTVNTISNTFGATMVGAQAHEIFYSQFMGVISFVLTFTILIFAEIIPKTLGALYWRKLSGVTAHCIQFFILMTMPLVYFLEKISNLLSRNKKVRLVTREEVMQMAELGKNDGALLEKESRIIRNVINLNLYKVNEVMTPESVVFSLPENSQIHEVVDLNKNIMFSRIPIYKNQTHHITGMVFRYQIYNEASEDNDNIRLKEMKAKLFEVNANDSVAHVLGLFIKRREHMFLVRNDKLKFVGIITLEDCIETLLGEEIVDEFDMVEDMRILAEQKQNQIKKKVMASKVSQVSTHL